MSNTQDAKPSFIKLTSTIQNILQKKPLDIITDKEWNNVLGTIIKTINENAESAGVALDYIKNIINGNVSFDVDINAKTLEGHPADDFILKDSLKPFTSITSTIEHNRYNVKFKVTKKGESSVDVYKDFLTSYSEKVPQYYFLYLTKDDNGNPTIGTITIGGVTSDHGTVLNEAYIGAVFDTSTLLKVPQYSYFAFMYSTPPDTLKNINTDDFTQYYNEKGVPDWEIGVIHNIADHQDFVRYIFSVVSNAGTLAGYVSNHIDRYCEYIRSTPAATEEESVVAVSANFKVHLQDGTTKPLSYVFDIKTAHSELLYLDINVDGDLCIVSEEVSSGDPIEGININYILNAKHDFRNYIAYVYVASEPPIQNSDFNTEFSHRNNSVGVVPNPHKDTVLAKQFIDRLYNEMQYKQMLNKLS